MILPDTITHPYPHASVVRHIDRSLPLPVKLQTLTQQTVPDSTTHPAPMKGRG